MLPSENRGCLGFGVCIVFILLIVSLCHECAKLHHDESFGGVHRGQYYAASSALANVVLTAAFTSSASTSIWSFVDVIPGKPGVPFAFAKAGCVYDADIKAQLKNFRSYIHRSPHCVLARLHSRIRGRIRPWRNVDFGSGWRKSTRPWRKIWISVPD